ncbi:MAG: adenylate/guanylate cyclase domain-containing protein [Nitrososphaerales archaeon]
MSPGERRLAAIMFTDMVGFTALTQSDEAQSLGVLERHNKLLRPIFPKFHGREVKTIGDSFLVEFDSALDATNCAVDIQRVLHDYNTSSRDGWKIVLRISIHLGDVVHREGDVFGDAGNIASRLQPLAEPEGVCISEQVYYQIMNKVPQPLVKLETHDLKGVTSPVDTYRVVMPWEQAGATTVARSDKNRVAVLPFANMSPDPADEYFADGMTEELIDRLAQVKEIEVIARTSVMTYKGEKKKASQMARELGVGSLVEGSVRKAGNRIRVTAQLISGATEGHLWSSHYDGNLDDIFAVQSEIAEKVARELKIHLLEADKKNLEKKPTDNTEAYSDFLRARELLRGEQTEITLRQALTLFEKAVELDPSFARAHVGIAECHIALADLYETKATAHGTARASLKRALELDPDLPEAHSSLSSLLFNEDELTGSEGEAARALELNPSLPDPHRLLFEIAATKGDRDGMVRHMENAYRLDPIMPLNILLLGEAYVWTGRDQEALEHWKKTEPVSPAYTYRGMGDYYLGKGEVAKAREYHEKVKRILPAHPWVIWMGGALDARSGDREKALLAIKKLEEDANRGPIVRNYMAYVYLSLGDLDSYFAQMDKALETRAQIQSFMMHSPLLAKAREDPRYQDLVDKVRRQTGLSK